MSNYVNPAYVQKASGILSQYAPLKQYSNTLGGVGNAAGVLGGIQQGGVSGDTSAAINAARLASRTGVLGQYTKSANSGLGSAANALGIYQGIKQGGVGGYGGAAVNAAQLGSRMGAFGGASGAIGTAAGYAAIPLSLYNEVKNWQSGATGQDALGGAATGAAIGSIVPGIGTAIGALLGGAAGALSSAFGSGKVAAENAPFEGYTQAYNKANQMDPKMAQNLAQTVQNPYLPLAGYFDLRSNQLKGNNPMYAQYGRMGEQKFVNDMVGQINQAAKSGAITNQDDANAIYNKVVDPWMASWGKGQSTDSNAAAMKGLLTQMISQYSSGDAAKNWTSIGGDQTFKNIGKLSFAPTTGPYGPSTQTAPTPTAQTPAMQSTFQSALRQMQPQPVQQLQQPQQMGINMPRRVMAKGGALRQRFDDGGDVDYVSDPGMGVYAPYGDDLTSFYPTMDNSVGQSYFDQDNPFSSYSQDIGDTGSIVNAQNDPYAYEPSEPTLKGNATGAGGLAGLLKAYGPLIPLVQGAISQATTKKPSLPSGMTNSAIGALPQANFARTQNMQPTNTGQPMSKQDWYTYGSRPEASFYNNNVMPLTQATGQAKGGRTPPHLQKSGALGQATGVPEFNSAQESYVGDHGPGDGQADQVPAQLSPGEYVFDAHTVSMLGNGSNKAGAARLDELRANLRKHAAQSNSKGKQFMGAKKPEQYMGKPKVKGKGKPVVMGED